MEKFKEQYSKNFLKANYNKGDVTVCPIFIQRTILKELFESKLQPLAGFCRVAEIQRTILKELFESKLQPICFTLSVSLFKEQYSKNFLKANYNYCLFFIWIELFKEQYSKNFLKANYNYDAVVVESGSFKEQYSKNFLKANYNPIEAQLHLNKIQRTILKELFESKLQLIGVTSAQPVNSKNNTQRTFWKQTTTYWPMKMNIVNSKNNTQRTFWKQTTTFACCINSK